MNRGSSFTGEIHERIGQVERSAWNACFPGEVEAHEYYTACQGARTNHRMAALSVSRGGQVLAVAPVFFMRFRLGTSLQAGPGTLAHVKRRLAGCIGLRFVGIGSPFGERCHIGVRSELDSAERRGVLDALIDTAEERARADGIRVVAVKDVIGDAEQEEIARVLRPRGYARLTSLPLAALDLTSVRSLDEYLATLSSSTRKDMQRKLRSAHAVRREDRTDITGIESALTELYESTRRMSRLDYGELEELPVDFFACIARHLAGRALFRLYWIGSTLAAFNLLLLEQDRVIDKFLGMRYPLAREHNLYALSWMENVRLCIERGARTLQTGQTAYREKIRLGSHLIPTSVWFRHRGAVVQRLLRACAPVASFERNDPELAAAASRWTG